MDKVDIMMLNIVLKIIIQDVGSKSELSIRKYKSMMALDDEVEANWASFIFTSLLDNVRRCRTVTKSKHLNDIHYGLMINYLLEQKMPVVDRREKLTDSDYLLYKNTRGMQFRTVPSARIPCRLGAGADVDKSIALPVFPTPS